PPVELEIVVHVASVIVELQLLPRYVLRLRGVVQSAQKEGCPRVTREPGVRRQERIRGEIRAESEAHQVWPHGVAAKKPRFHARLYIVPPLVLRNPAAEVRGVGMLPEVSGLAECR